MEHREDIQPKVHMFICTRLKEKGECCATKGSAEIRLQLKTWIKENNLKDKVKVTASQCLGHCENGISVCIYPENKWFLNVRPEDLETLKQELLTKVTP